MCTVTFIPTDNGFYFTSSRDEKESRKTIPPQTYLVNKKELVFPKDELAGGTWIASDFNGNIACLLNGAFVNHTKKEKYSKSRGLILLESFNYNSITDFINSVELKSVEPFTLLLLNYKLNVLNEFVELRWDGENKHVKQLSLTENQIWSSATLYTPDVQLKREHLFEQWVQENSTHEDKQIFNFHNQKHGLDASHDIMMQREGDLKTISISQLQVSTNQVNFNYLDVVKQENYSIKL